MPTEKVYESSLPWNPTRPDTIVICCVDGRWRRHVIEFAANYLHAELLTDIMAVPGGVEPLTLMDLIPKDFNFFKRRLEALVATHGTKRIVAIAHQDCAWYKERKIGPIRIDLRSLQLADLRRAASGIRETFPSIKVETYYARLEGENPARVVFDAV